MKWIKTILIGIIATFGMDLAMKLIMITLGSMPTNIHPAAAFLYNLGVEVQFLSLLLHYCYGTLWALVFVYAFEEAISIKRAVQLAIVLWIFMMIVYSPIIGWGFFGVGSAQLLHSDHPLYLNSTAGFLFVNLTVHLVYGFLLGFLADKILSRKKHL